MDIQQWLQLTSQLGAGVTFVLGIVVYKLWQRLSEETDYCRQRDKEVTGVLNHLTSVLESIRTLIERSDSGPR